MPSRLYATRSRGGNEETVLQGAIMEALEACGFLVLKNSSGRRGHIRLGLHCRRHPKGSSDLLVLMDDGRYAFLEVKLPGAEQKGDKERLKAQQDFRDHVMTMGGVACVVTSVTQTMRVLGVIQPHEEW